EPRQHGGGIFGELAALFAAVVADDDAAAFRVGNLLEHVATEALRGLDDDGAVHSIGPRAEKAPQARGSEGEPRPEAITKRRLVVRAKQLLELGARFGIGIGRKP